MDVIALYQSVPINLMIQLLFDKMNSAKDFEKTMPFTLMEIKQFLEICLNLGNYFQDCEKFWKMNNMGPIGCSLLTVGCECFLQHFEQTALDSSKLISLGFKDLDFWKHYVDDVLENVSDRFDHNNFLTYMNSHYPEVQFTCEVQEGEEFNFLDIKMITDFEGKVETKVYRKPTHTNLYTHHTTNADKNVKTGLIETLTRRGINICSTNQHLKEELELLEDIFTANGYERGKVKDTIKKTEKKVYKEEFQKVMNPEEFAANKEMKKAWYANQIRIVVPYPGDQKAGKMRRVAAKYGVCLSYNSNNTIKKGLVKLKCKTTTDKKKDVIYQVPLNCGKSYIGESGQLWEERKKQHMNAFNKKDIRQSAIFEHMTECGNLCGCSNPGAQWNNAKILGQEGQINRRRIRESIEIKLQNKKTPKTINRNEGQPELNNIWEKAMNNFS